MGFIILFLAVGLAYVLLRAVFKIDDELSLAVSFLITPFTTCGFAVGAQMLEVSGAGFSGLLPILGILFLIVPILLVIMGSILLMVPIGLFLLFTCCILKK